ncbi:MAG: GNAT family N-acetyltransferase [Paracoccaceae bacterium]|nr:GNAT family N-acetyltransferase [Paracoccaceae bacterium]
MSAALTLATPDHLDKLDALVAAFHQETGIDLESEPRRAGIAPLLDGSPHGVVYLIGPPKAPIGYIVVTFGWSLEFGGLDGFIDELYVRPGVRDRGIASETLQSLPRALSDAGMKAIHLEVDRTAEKTQRLYTRAGFAMRPHYMLMTRKL